MRLAAAITLLMWGVVAFQLGCHRTPAGAGSSGGSDVWQGPPPRPVEHPKSVMVAEGLSPLVFQVREPAVAHVLDLTTGLEVASAAVGRGDLVYVSEDSGAFAGKRRLVSGPFEKGHRYGISIDVGAGESWESKIQVLPPPTQPATQPQVR